MDIGKLIQHIRSILWPPLPEQDELEGSALQSNAQCPFHNQYEMETNEAEMKMDYCENGCGGRKSNQQLHSTEDGNCIMEIEIKTAPIAHPFTSVNYSRTLSSAVDEQFDSLHQILNKCSERIQYAKNLWIWEARQEFIPRIFQKLFQKRRLERESKAEAWNSHIRSMNDSDINQLMSPKKCKKTLSVEPPSIDLQPTVVDISDSIEPKKPLTCVQQSQSKKQTFSSQTVPPVDQSSSQRKVSQFFIPITKEIQEELRASNTIFDELFPSFFVKEFTSIARINQFYLRGGNRKNEDVNSFSSLQWFKFVAAGRARRIPPAQGKVMGAFEGDLFVKFKLFQFHDNYRPAYFGTMRKRIPSSLCPRNPFKQDSSGLLNYAIDSDQEWEEEELMDVEVISSEEDDSDNYESDLLIGNDESDDDFIIAEESESAISKSNSSRRSKIHLAPSINSYPTSDDTSHGIYFVFYNNILGMPTNPFEVIEVNGSTSQKKYASFDSALISALTELAQDSLLGIEQLFEEFIKKTGKLVTKKSFQQALKQIATRQRINGQKYKWQLKESTN